ncbi:MAG: class I tRNA ligase family protein [Saprospiraceae bacterium]
MSKSKYNVIKPDEVVNQYGADTFRMYEMFLGPIEQSKPWDTQGYQEYLISLRNIGIVF